MRACWWFFVCATLMLVSCKKKDTGKDTAPAKEPSAARPDTARKAPAGKPSGSAEALVDAMIEKVGRAAGCPSQTAPHRVWCIAADGWKKGEPALLLGVGPTRVYYGLVMVVAEDRPVDFNSTRLAAVAVRGDGPKRFGKIIDVKPDNPEESRMMAEAVFNLAKVFKGMAQAAPIPLPLLNFLATQPAKAVYPLTKGPNGWKLEGKLPGELRRVGPYWVGVEVDTKGRRGIFLGVFTHRVKIQAAKK